MGYSWHTGPFFKIRRNGEKSEKIGQDIFYLNKAQISLEWLIRDVPD